MRGIYPWPFNSPHKGPVLQEDFQYDAIVIPRQLYNDVIMNARASQSTGVSVFYSTVCSGADLRKHQSSASLDFVRRIHRWPVNSPHKWPVTWKMLPFDDVIMIKFLLQQSHRRTRIPGWAWITSWVSKKHHKHPMIHAGINKLITSRQICQLPIGRH